MSIFFKALKYNDFCKYQDWLQNKLVNIANSLALKAYQIGL